MMVRNRLIVLRYLLLETGLLPSQPADMQKPQTGRLRPESPPHLFTKRCRKRFYSPCRSLLRCKRLLRRRYAGMKARPNSAGSKRKPRLSAAYTSISTKALPLLKRGRTHNTANTSPKCQRVNRSAWPSTL